MAKYQTKIDDSHNLPLLPIILPWVAFDDRDKLPQTSGIYFALGHNGEVLYVGQSQNIHQRWMHHHHKTNLDTLNCTSIAYYPCSTDDLRLIEKSMILQFIPPLNGEPAKPRILKQAQKGTRAIFPRWQHLLDVLKEHPLPTLTELSSALGKAPATVQADLSLMRKAGVRVVTEFRYGGTRYRLPEERPFTPVQTLLLQLTMHLDELSTPELQALAEAIATHVAARLHQNSANLPQ